MLNKQLIKARPLLRVKANFNKNKRLTLKENTVLAITFQSSATNQMRVIEVEMVESEVRFHLLSCTFTQLVIQPSCFNRQLATCGQLGQKFIITLNGKRKNFAITKLQKISHTTNQRNYYCHISEEARSRDTAVPGL